ncbi:MAG: sigma-54-dependent Fis family transcriptional regulator [Bacteroidales bacterium]|nr:sigma-54-dependent Fis family transcriptional regulator [Bacteroidales bacterium]MBR4218556.1 sigma-54-dependent Fis family transcriptional regulator [Bacteroidales bacterium]
MEQRDLIAVKQRYGIIGHDATLDRAIDIAVQVAKTNLTVLITGESGVGKENFSKIIHDNSPRKHGRYIAVNCGAIPEGTIDSELFGHEKGAFTGAVDSRKGYFEEANGGTIFLDEVADLPLATQVRLLRVLESGEFIRVGSSKPQKTDVRVVAATNVNIPHRISEGKFREDLYYRLNTVPIHVPSLRDRKDDIILLFTKFASDFSEHYHMPAIELTPAALEVLKNYPWPGNIRQLKNVTEQMSIIERKRTIDEQTVASYLPDTMLSGLPVLLRDQQDQGKSVGTFERELIYKYLSEMKDEVKELKKMVNKMAMMNDDKLQSDIHDEDIPVKISHAYALAGPKTIAMTTSKKEMALIDEPEVVDDSCSLVETEKELVKKALIKHNNNRRKAAEELGISERTLYRKINEFGL